jgi:hypothetical protein
LGRVDISGKRRKKNKEQRMKKANEIISLRGREGETRLLSRNSCFSIGERQENGNEKEK